jgi:GNAT superfamily N-acetyltransferase
VQVVIRDAVESDMPAISAVMCASTAVLRKVYSPSPSAAKRARSAADVHWIVAVEGKDIVGALRYVAKPENLHLGLGVHPDHQRKGVARALIAFLAEKALCQGISKLSLYTIKETGNMPIFERLGFSFVSEGSAEDCESATGDQLTDVYMERVLS